MESAKRSFNRAANAVFGKIEITASEEVTLQVIKSKCLPVAIIWFRSVSTNCIGPACIGLRCKQSFHEIIEYEYFDLPSSIIEKRRKSFVARWR